MELGTIQKAWVQSLREHPERQGRKQLGEVYVDGTYKACCLGELLMVNARLKGIEIPIGTITDKCVGYTDTHYLNASYKKFGLRTSRGHFMLPGEIYPKIGSHRYSNLAIANDEGATWSEIADFIEANPDLVFNESV